MKPSYVERVEPVNMKKLSKANTSDMFSGMFTASSVYFSELLIFCKIYYSINGL